MFHFLFTLLAFTFCAASYASIDPIVRVEIEKAGNTSHFEMRLFQDITPSTVANFLNYASGTTASGASYDGTFFHRSVSGFALQGGRYYFDPALGDFSYDPVSNTFTGGLQKIITDQAIPNEVNLSNTRGTVAMAKVPARYTNATGEPANCTIEGPDCILVAGTGPDSATSEWFINLGDNSAFLDAQNGGFTVFAEVLSESMPVVDEIATTPVYDFSPIPGFKTLPLSDYTAGDNVQAGNLITVKSVSELFKISEDIDFGDTAVGSTTDTTVTIKTATDKSLIIGNIGDINPANNPFSIVPGNCANTTLSSNSECSFTVRLKTDSISTSSDNFNIEFPEINMSYTLRLKASNAPDIYVSRTTVDFGDITPYSESTIIKDQEVLLIENVGVKNLTLAFVETTTSGTGNEFEVINNCKNFFPVLAPGQVCAIPVNFIGLDTGIFSFKLTINSNDPDQPEIIVPFNATIVSDLDNVDSEIEDNAPNNGDGNYDGIPDSAQSNVASFHNLTGGYLTLVNNGVDIFTDVNFTTVDQFGTPYEGSGPEDGVLTYQVSDIQPGATTTIGLYLPSDFSIDDYKLLSTDNDSNTTAWENSETGIVDTEGTGVNFINNAKITTPSGSTEIHDLVIITLKDGGYGDTDNTTDGVIHASALVLMKPKTKGEAAACLDIIIVCVTITALLLARKRGRKVSFL